MSVTMPDPSPPRSRRRRDRTPSTVAWAMARLLIVGGVVALGVAVWVVTRPVVNPGVQDCGTSIEWFARGRQNVPMGPGAPNAPSDPRRAVELEAQPTCRDRAATEMARAGVAAAAFVGLTLLGIVVGLVDDRVALWRAPKFESYLRELPVEGRVRRGLVARVDAADVSAELPPVESTEVTGLVVGSAAALVGLPFAATISTVPDVVSSVGIGWLVAAIVVLVPAFVLSAVGRWRLDPTGQDLPRWLTSVVAASWQAGLRPYVAWFGIDLHRLRRAGSRRAPAVSAVQHQQAVSVLVHAVVAALAVWSWLTAERPVVDPRGPLLVLLAVTALLVGNGLTRLPARWRAYPVRPAWSAWRSLPGLGAERLVVLGACALGGIVVRALVLQCCLAAFGASAPTPWVLLVSVAATAIGAAGPFPHGAGTTEAVTMLLLVFAAGVSAPSAACAAIAWRVVTFWLPMVPGAVVARRLDRSPAGGGGGGT